MTDDIGRFSNSNDDDLAMLNNFARAFRGCDSIFNRAVRALFAAGQAPPKKFLQKLDWLDTWILEKDRTTQEGDATIPARWLGLSSLVRAVLVKDDTARRRLLKASTQHFGNAWTEAAQHFLPGVWDPNVAADSTSARSENPETFAKYGVGLQPWSIGSWLAWDILTQANGTSTPVAIEKANVLFERGEGHVMRLAVELLPGPARLVTPNFWQLGMTSFPTEGGAGKYFVGAVQRALTLASPPDRAYRMRWFLEATDPSEDWTFGLEGRSVEAAAACAGLAAFEWLRERDESRDGKPPEPVLDEKAAVSAKVGDGQAWDVLERPLEAIEGLTIKFAAAARHGIDKVGIAQPLNGAVVPPGIGDAQVETLADAMEVLRAVSRKFRRYKDWVRTQFAYHEEDTPPRA